MRVRGQEMLDPQVRLQRLSVVDPKTGCWNWQGGKRRGYGRLTIGSRASGDRRTVSAHRYAFEVFKGPITEGLHVCHSCDNPSCINPDHLWQGTKQENTDDRERKGRNRPPKGEKNGAAKLTTEQVTEMRNLHSSGVGYYRLSKRFGVNKKTVISAIKKITWIPAPPTGDAPTEKK